ncbi:hypothetical protein C8J56DRAFT_587076 [Mycena floridula]|nr:hypothetical protein C8J56DRAFT_587076 [Mycena floridula]
MQSPVVAVYLRTAILIITMPPSALQFAISQSQQPSSTALSWYIVLIYTVPQSSINRQTLHSGPQPNWTTSIRRRIRIKFADCPRHWLC